MTNPRYEMVAARARRRCEYCRAPDEVFNVRFEVEHVIPPTLGGTDADDNLALSCRSCNVRKGVRIEGVDPETGSAARLYHPRRDRWGDHFHVDVDCAIVEGGTSEIQRTSIATRGLGMPRD